MSEREIDDEIAIHIATVDGMKVIARDMVGDDLRAQVVHELLDLAARILEGWQADRENRKS